jgi:hypothetical protein
MSMHSLPLYVLAGGLDLRTIAFMLELTTNIGEKEPGAKDQRSNVNTIVAAPKIPVRWPFTVSLSYVDP